MIVGLSGKITKKEPSKVHLQTNGVTYEVLISLNSYQKLFADEQFLHICHLFREDAQQLCGFIDESEKRLFESLIKINGIGAKAALAICSTLTPAQFASALANKDVSAFKRAPGIGPKTAARIMVEMGQFKAEEAMPSALNEAFMALESLGFKPDEITKALSQVKTDDTAQAVREALAKLQKF